MGTRALVAIAACLAACSGASRKETSAPEPVAVEPATEVVDAATVDDPRELLATARAFCRLEGEIGSASEVDAVTLTRESRAAATRGQFERALCLCQAALEQDSRNQDANTVCVIAACNLHRVELAEVFTDRLESKGRRGMARAICDKQNGDEIFHLEKLAP